VYKATIDVIVLDTGIVPSLTSLLFLDPHAQLEIALYLTPSAEIDVLSNNGIVSWVMLLPIPTMEECCRSTIQCTIAKGDISPVNKFRNRYWSEIMSVATSCTLPNGIHVCKH
jgi:hypothetical protein